MILAENRRPSFGIILYWSTFEVLPLGPLAYRASALLLS